MLSAKPGVWPPTSRQEDELSLRDLFEAVCTFKGGGAWQFIDAATMQDTLRRFGCERFVVLSEEPVDAARFIAQGCHEDGSGTLWQKEAGQQALELITSLRDEASAWWSFMPFFSESIRQLLQSSRSPPLHRQHLTLPSLLALRRRQARVLHA